MSKLDKKSICGKCEYYSYYQGIHCCIAFPPPNGIPEKYKSGKELHKQIDKEQRTDYFFSDKRDLLPKL